MGALQVAEFNQLMVDESGVTIGNEQVTFAGLEFQAGNELAGGGTGGENDVGGGDVCAIVQLSNSGAGFNDAAAGDEGCAAAAGGCEKIARGAGGVNDGVVFEQKRAGEARAQIGFGGAESLFIEGFDSDVAQGVKATFAMDFVHFGGVGRDPERTAGEILSVGRKFGRKLFPQRLRVTGEGELGGGIVHDGEVTHAGGGGAAAYFGWLDEGNR
jgi:hypothetical protein